jgi:hypothetical protein
MDTQKRFKPFLLCHEERVLQMSIYLMILYGSRYVICLETDMHLPLSMSPCQDGGFPVETSDG